MHMTPKHWCVRAAHEREEGVKTHRYAVLKGCRERDIVRRPLPFKLHQSYRPLPCFIPALQEIWSGPAKNSAVMAVMTSTPRLASHYRGEAVMRLSSQPYVYAWLCNLNHSLGYYILCLMMTIYRFIPHNLYLHPLHVWKLKFIRCCFSFTYLYLIEKL